MVPPTTISSRALLLFVSVPSRFFNSGSIFWCISVFQQVLEYESFYCIHGQAILRIGDISGQEVALLWISVNSYML